MKICIQVLYNDSYWIHYLKRIDGTLYWVYDLKDPYSKLPFPDHPILSPNGRKVNLLRIPYMEGDL